MQLYPSIPFGPRTFQGTQHSLIYTPAHPGKQKEEKGWIERKEQILNTALLNPSAQDEMQKVLRI